MPPSPVLLATAGGTIDKAYFPVPGSLLVGPPAAPRALERAGFPFAGPLPLRKR